MNAKISWQKFNEKQGIAQTKYLLNLKGKVVTCQRNLLGAVLTK